MLYMQKQTHTQGIESSDLPSTVGIMQRVGVCVGAYRDRCECDRRVSEFRNRNANCGRKKVSVLAGVLQSSAQAWKKVVFEDW